MYTTNNAREQNLYDLQCVLKQWPEDKKAMAFVKILGDACVLDEDYKKAEDYYGKLFKRDCPQPRIKKPMQKLVPLWGH
ncbi:MAG: hypothetical protein WC856_02345 [Methylococcaceae bacterium]